MDSTILYIIGSFMLIDAIRGILRWNAGNVLRFQSKQPVPPFVEESPRKIAR